MYSNKQILGYEFVLFNLYADPVLFASLQCASRIRLVDLLFEGTLDLLKASATLKLPCRSL